MPQLTRAEEMYLKLWAQEELQRVHGPAHELQAVHGAETADLAARFRAWVAEERLDPVSLTRMLEHPVSSEPVIWPWTPADAPSAEGSWLEHFTAGHRRLLALAAQQAGFTDPVAVHAGALYWPLLNRARKRELLPVDGVLVHDWCRYQGWNHPGAQLGVRLYDVEGIRFAVISFPFTDHYHQSALHFLAMDRRDYRKLYRLARQADRDEAESKPPILPPEQAETLWRNTVGYLDRHNLRRIQALGGRARRGVLLTGAPGNGKTMACRWLWEECKRRGWEWKLIAPDDYRMARSQGSVEQLFSVQRRGILFFDDMDLALRDRETVGETEDQSVFLTALDGIRTSEGVVFVFTTNCPLDWIDRAFKRPGRIDVALEFGPPEAELRRRLLESWHPEIQAGLDAEEVVASTAGYSFAEIEELKNLLIMQYMDTGAWDWDWALRQFDINREDLARRPVGRVGFQPREADRELA